MAKGRIRQMRLHALSQASLVWASDLTTERATNFIETGSFGEGDDPEILPCNPALRDAIVKQWGH